MGSEPLNPNDPPLRVSLLRIAVRFAVVLAAAFVLATAMDWAMSSASSIADDISTGMMLGAIAFFLLVYALLIAVPFVPGIEIGLALLVMRGEAVAPYVYLATVAGLMLAYGVGQLTSDQWLHRFFADLRMRRVCNLIERTSSLSQEERLAALKDRLPRPLQPIGVQGRYVLLAALLNLPGNSLIGGGGGLSLLAGLSRLYSPIWTLVTIAIAVLPVPLVVWIWGGQMLGLG